MGFGSETVRARFRVWLLYDVLYNRVVAWSGLCILVIERWILAVAHLQHTMFSHPSFPRLRSTFLLVICTTHLHGIHASVGVVNPDTLLPPTPNIHNPQNQKPLLSTHNHHNDHESPWSHDPFCVRSTSISTMGRKYCVYTSNLTGPAGMSLIMEPQKAEEAAPLLNENPLDNFLSRTQAEQLYLGKPDRPYKVVQIPGKGMGVLATRLIAQYETIMVDQASVVVALNVEKMVGKAEARKMLYKAVQQLRVPGEVRGLSGEHHAGSEGDAVEGEVGKLEEDVMLTNSFGSQVADVDCRALFPLISVCTVFLLELFCSGLSKMVGEEMALLLPCVLTRQTENQPRMQPKCLRPLLPRRRQHGRKSLSQHLTRGGTQHLLHNARPAFAPA